VSRLIVSACDQIFGPTGMSSVGDTAEAVSLSGEFPQKACKQHVLFGDSTTKTAAMKAAEKDAARLAFRTNP
jgi:hypothetical protein